MVTFKSLTHIQFGPKLTETFVLVASSFAKYKMNHSKSYSKYD